MKYKKMTIEEIELLRSKCDKAIVQAIKSFENETNMEILGVWSSTSDGRHEIMIKNIF